MNGKPPLVNQPSRFPTRKVTAGMLALGAVNAAWAIGDYYGVGWMSLSAVEDFFEMSMAFVGGWIIKDRAAQ